MTRVSIPSILRTVRPNVVAVSTAAGQGSGVILGRVAESTLIATNYHLLPDDPDAEWEVMLRDTDGSEMVGQNTEILWCDRAIDFVIAATDMPSRKKGFRGLGPRARMPQIGEEIYAVGNPHELAPVVSRGIVSGLYHLNGVPMILHDAHINPGNSGGALVDARGKLLGLVCASLSEDTEGLNLAVPMDYVMFRSKPLADILDNGGERPLPSRYTTDQLVPDDVPEAVLIEVLKDNIQTACGLDIQRRYRLALFERSFVGRRTSIRIVLQHQALEHHVFAEIEAGGFTLIELRDGKWHPAAAAAKGQPPRRRKTA